MIQTFKLEDIRGTPDQRRLLLLAVKQAAKKASVKIRIWWDPVGLHIQGPKAFLQDVASKMPKRARTTK